MPVFQRKSFFMPSCNHITIMPGTYNISGVRCTSQIHEQKTLC